MTDLPMTKADDDELLELLRTKCGGCEGICEEAADEITRLRAQLAAAEATIADVKNELGYSDICSWPLSHSVTLLKAELTTAKAQLQAMRKALEAIDEISRYGAKKLGEIADEDLSPKISGWTKTAQCRFRLISEVCSKALTEGAEK